VVVAAIEIGLHWLLGHGDNPRLRGVYLYSHDSGGKAFVAYAVDNIIPAFLLGWVNGWVGFPGWSVRKFIVTTVAIAMLVDALVPVYKILIGPEFAVVWGRSSAAADVVGHYIYSFVTAFMIAGFFSHGAYVFRRDSKKRGSMRGRY
jgi:hypothetical protein